jgi:hypothetical protein
MNKALIAAALTFTSASATLITNGSFEITDNRTGASNNRALNSLNPGKWDVYETIPGWTTLSGRGIEIQATGVVVNAQDGVLYVELDSHPNSKLGGSTNSSMYQDVMLGVGNYLLTFWYRPRTNTANDNGIQVQFNNQAVYNVSTTTGAQNFWAKQEVLLQSTSAGSQRIAFGATGTANQLGGFIDNVSLTAQVPEPATLGLIGGALTALGLLGRKRIA